MPRNKKANGFTTKRANPSAEALDNQTRNELQKTLLLVEYRHILEKERSSLLRGFEELLEKGKKSMSDLKVTLRKPSASVGRRNPKP